MTEYDDNQLGWKSVKKLIKSNWKVIILFILTIVVLLAGLIPTILLSKI